MYGRTDSTSSENINFHFNMNCADVLVGDVVRVKDDIAAVDSSIQNVNGRHVVAESGRLALNGNIMTIQSRSRPLYFPI